MMANLYRIICSQTIYIFLSYFSKNKVTSSSVFFTTFIQKPIIMKKIKILLTLLSLTILIPLYLSAQVMPKGNGYYFVNETGNTGFASLKKLRKRAYNSANSFAAERGTTAEIVSVNETPQSFMIFPSVEVTFRLVGESKVVADPNQSSISISSSSNAYGKTTSGEVLINSKQDDAQKYEKLTKLGELLDKGYITKEEFDIEKKKTLGILTNSSNQGEINNENIKQGSSSGTEEVNKKIDDNLKIKVKQSGLYYNGELCEIILEISETEVKIQYPTETGIGYYIKIVNLSDLEIVK